MRQIERRLQRLESSSERATSKIAIVIYDPVTGKVLTPIVGNPDVIVRIPDNGRGDYHYMEEI